MPSDLFRVDNVMHGLHVERVYVYSRATSKEQLQLLESVDSLHFQQLGYVEGRRHIQT